MYILQWINAFNVPFDLAHIAKYFGEFGQLFWKGNLFVVNYVAFEPKSVQRVITDGGYLQKRIRSLL